MFKKKCYQGGNVHNFQQRYSQEPNTEFLKIINYKGNVTLPAITFEQCSVLKKYIHDVCIWCGKIIDKRRQK